MAAFEAFDVVVVPFPFSDREATRKRPALVLSGWLAFNQAAGHSVLAMITSARHARWVLDVDVTDLAAAGLPQPSLIRMKLFTLDNRLILGKAGRLSAADAASARKAISCLLG